VKCCVGLGGIPFGLPPPFEGWILSLINWPYYLDVICNSNLVCSIFLRLVSFALQESPHFDNKSLTSSPSASSTCSCTSHVTSVEHQRCIDQVGQVLCKLDQWTAGSTRLEAQTALVLRIAFARNQNQADLFYALNSFWRYVTETEGEEGSGPGGLGSGLGSPVLWFGLALASCPLHFAKPAAIQVANLLLHSRRPHQALSLLDELRGPPRRLSLPSATVAGLSASAATAGFSSTAPVSLSPPSSTPSSPRGNFSCSASTSSSSPSSPRSQTRLSLGPLSANSNTSFTLDTTGSGSEPSLASLGWELIIGALCVNCYELVDEEVLALLEMEALLALALRLANTQSQSQSHDSSESSNSLPTEPILSSTLDLPTDILTFYLKEPRVNVWTLFRSLLAGLFARLVALTQTHRIFELCDEIWDQIHPKSDELPNSPANSNPSFFSSGVDSTRRRQLAITDLEEKFEVYILCGRTLASIGAYDRAMKLAMALHALTNQLTNHPGNVDEIYEGIALTLSATFHFSPFPSTFTDQSFIIYGAG